ncbi:MAG: protein kinase [Anaerolineae bacterium]|nr:protein kinase [Anaerolineae bacterium]
MHDLTGKTLLDCYRIETMIGRGGMAEVYKVWDQKRSTYLALKMLREDLALDRVFLRRFKREAQTLSRLQHPDIVRFYGLEQDGQRAFMLMDFIPGSSLKHIIFDAAGPLSPDRIRHLVRPVLSALQYAHSEGYVHCDLKPGNIMIDSQGRALLADFGISRMTDAATATMVGAGTPAYMAPEQIKGQDPLPQTDIYALGVVLYEMVTGGERPFTGESPNATGSTSEKVVWEQLNLPPPSPRQFNPALSSELEAVILRCLEKDPAKRFATALDLRNALELALGVPQPGSPIYTPPTEPVEPITAQPALAKPKLPKSVLLAVVSFVAVLVAIFVFGGQPVSPGSVPGTPISLSVATRKSDGQSQVKPSATPRPATQVPVAGTPTPKLYYPLPNCAASRLRKGDSAFVSYGGGRNSIRDTPDTHPSDNIIGYAESGEVLVIVGGPECNFGWVLWEVVTAGGLQGWTPEGDGSEFWLVPITTQRVCTGAPRTRLAVGMRAFVGLFPPLANTVRKTPGTSSQSLGKIQPGGKMTILDGPDCANNMVWWKVRATSGSLTGWTAEGNTQNYWLVPIP